jgi:Glycosyltransferase family 25 (LPS biosynthesis protein)
MDLHTIPCLLIHRTQDTIREASIHELEKRLGKTLQKFEGISGHFLLKDGFPRKHPHETEPTSLGNIGCTASHIEILEAAIKSKYTHCCIFEDDAEVVGNLQDYFSLVDTLPAADIVLLGVNTIIDSTETTIPEIKKVTRFWGTHAVVVGRRGMLAILNTYKKYVDAGYALPADWLYSYAIKDYELIAYAPVKPVIRQRPGFISLITGKIRK